jgi:hypothetical protein
MIGLVTKLLSGLGRRAAFWSMILGAVLVALWIAFRRGRRQGEAEFILRRANARIRSLQTAKEVSDEVQNAARADLERRLDRWMRD